MNATRQLRNLGQSPWLDNITRRLIKDVDLGRYINEFSITGLTCRSQRIRVSRDVHLQST